MDELDVVVGLSPLGDGPSGHARFASRAVELGYGRLWLPEAFILDPVSFAGWCAATFPGRPLGLGVLPSPLRSGAQLAMTAATLASLGVDDLVVALGTSSPKMMAGWHGRPPATVDGTARLIAEARAAASGRTESGFVNALGPVPLRIYLAAFGPRMLRLAGATADGLALNFIGPDALPAVLATLDDGARSAGRTRPPVTVWTHVTVDPSDADVRAARRFIGAYLRVPGYDRMLALHGYADAVAAARGRSAREAAELVTDEMLRTVTGFGSAADARARVDAYRSHGATVALMPGAVRPGAATGRTLEALAPRPQR